MNIRKLAGDTAIYGLSNAVTRFLSYLLVPYYTRVMSTGEYGVVTDLYALIPFALVILTMGMEVGYFRFSGKARGDGERRELFATTWGAVSLVSVVFMLLVALFNKPLAGVLGYGDHASYIWLTGGIVMFDAIKAVPMARLREQGRAKRYMAINVAAVCINLLLCLFFYTSLPSLAADGYFTSIYDPSFGAGYVLVANVIASAATLVMLLPTCGGIAPKITPSLFRKVFVFSLPLMISGLAGTANEFIDRQMIKYIMPADEAMSALGIYGSVAKLASIMYIFTSIYKLGAEPFFLAEFKGDDFKKVNAQAMKYYIIAALLIFLVIALYSDLFALILGADFREGVWILPIMLVSNLLSGVILNLSFWYKQSGRTRYSLYITGTGLAFTIAFNIVLIPVMGYAGAAVARLICESAMVVVSYYLCRRHCGIPYDLRRIGGYVLLAGGLYGVGILAGGLNSWVKYLLYLILLAIFVLFAARREKIDIKGLAKSVIKRR